MNPVDQLEPLNVKLDRRRDRQALTVEELRNMLNTTAAGPARNSMNGSEQALLYRLAVESGLRSNELRSLTKASFDLNDTAPTVTVEAAYSKRKRQDTLPLRPETVPVLRSPLASKTPTARAFHIPVCR